VRISDLRIERSDGATSVTGHLPWFNMAPIAGSVATRSDVMRGRDPRIPPEKQRA
jgi:hypothetical protein